MLEIVHVGLAAGSDRAAQSVNGGADRRASEYIHGSGSLSRVQRDLSPLHFGYTLKLSVVTLARRLQRFVPLISYAATELYVSQEGRFVTRVATHGRVLVFHMHCRCWSILKWKSLLPESSSRP